MGKTAWRTAILLIALCGAAGDRVFALTATTTTLQGTPNPSILGRAVTLTASVTPAAVTGKITFYNKTDILGVATIAGGQATLTTSLLPSGTGSLRAYYGGDSTYAASRSTAVAQTVTSLPENLFQSTVRTFGTGSQPAFIGVGDFNRDGKVDLVTADQNSATVTVLLGNGDGTFQTGVAYTVGLAPGFVAVGDFNGDGFPDLAVANHDSNNVSVLLGNGNGTFQSAAAYSVGNAPFSLAVGDFNGDGFADLAVVNSGENTNTTLAGNSVSILIGNGNGTFQPKVDYNVGADPGCIVTADFDADGKTDLAVSNYIGGSVSILMGQGDGTFLAQAQSPVAVGGGPNCMAAADFNADGKVDLAVVNFDAGTVTVLLGNGDGTFAQTPGSPYATGSEPYAVIAADFNGDGIPDLVTANFSTSDVSLLFGKGDGTFQAAVSIPAGSGALYPVPADFNGDGRTDLAVANQTAGNISVFLGVPVYPVFTITGAPTGSFTQGQSGASLSITVNNTGTVKSSGLVTVTAALPAGLMATAMSGTGWNCVLSTLSCSRSDVAAAFPGITLTLNVASNAASSLTIHVAVSSTGGASSANVAIPVTPASLAYSSSIAAPPGGTANLPVNLSLTSGTVTAINLTVTITPANGAPALTGSLSFTKDANQPAPTTSNATSSTMTLAYSAVSLAGMIHLGDIAVTIPAAATQNQSYTVSIGVTGVMPNTTVVGSGLNATLNPYTAYLVGDAFPAASSYAGTFGDNSIDTLDLLTVLRAVTGVVLPAKCSDIFDAMDAYPNDVASPPTRGGDGVIDTRDLLVVLRRVTNADKTRPTRAPQGKSCTAASPFLRVPEPAHGEGGNPEAALEMVPGEMDQSSGLTAIYLRANVQLSLAALALSVSGGDGILGFVADGTGGPSLVDDGVAGKLSLAWLQGFQARAGDRVLLGYVQTAAPESLRFFGVSANTSGSGRPIAIGFPSAVRRTR